MARRNDIDWDLIEREYRLGQKSNKQIAIDHGVQPSTIGRRAEKYGWVQDKAGEVRLRAENLRVQDTAKDVAGNANGNATRNANANATPSDADVKVAARVVADVVLGHRKGLGKLSRLRDRMLDEIEAQTIEQDMLVELTEAHRTRDDGEVVASKRDDLVGRIISLPGRVESLRKLTEIDEKIRKGEREAFGIEKSGPDEVTTIATLSNTERASRAAAILALALAMQRRGTGEPI